MAKQQDLPSAQMEISGVCGRLLCCLGLENDAYTACQRKAAPNRGRSSTPSTVVQDRAGHVIKESCSGAGKPGHRRSIVPGRGNPTLSRSPAATTDDRLRRSGSSAAAQRGSTEILSAVRCCPAYVHVRKRGHKHDVYPVKLPRTPEQWSRAL